MSELRGAPTKFGKLSAQCPLMQDVVGTLDRLAKTDVTVTLVGETGTGKDVLANAIHNHSSRANGPMVVFDCGAVPANLAESELLGHERGAFTGALGTHVGAFERAHGGTLFLDEIGELPLDLQPRLLRILEGRRVRRVGGTQERAIDVRVVAATNRDLQVEVSHGRFRQDLFFRLAAAVVRIPPLRDRKVDLVVLVPGLLAELGRPDLHVTDATFEALHAHEWPGNVRELKNALACALAFLEGDRLEPHHLRLVPPSETHESSLDRLALAGQPLDRIERVAIKQTLAKTGGNKVHAARALGIAVSTLYEKVKKYDLH